TAGPVARNRYKLRHPGRNWGKRKPGANAFMSVVDPQASLVFDGDVLHEVEALVANFSTPHSSAARVAPGTVETADRNARHCISAEVGALRAGSEAHKRAMCTMFRETFNPYRPSVIAWPKLDAEELRRVR